MNTEKLMELERKWRAEVDVDPPSEYDTGWNECTVKCADELAAALRAEQAVGEEQIALELLASCAAGRIQRTDGLVEVGQAVDAIRRALGTARQPENIGEFVIALLIAGGYVTQAKVDEARNIALGHGPYEMPARQSEERVLVQARDLRAILDNAVPHRDDTLVHRRLRALLSAAPGGEGEG